MYLTDTHIAGEDREAAGEGKSGSRAPYTATTILRGKQDLRERYHEDPRKPNRRRGHGTVTLLLRAREVQKDTLSCRQGRALQETVRVTRSGGYHV